jgi:tetratricopeptide (TPR) repeat protein
MVSSRDRSLEAAIDNVLSIIATERSPHPALSRRLDGLFRRLREAGSPDEVQSIQDLVWALWCDHPDKPSRDAMHEGIAAMAEEDFDTALSIFDALVIAEPNWTEAWNKRATVFFILKHERECLADIARVLKREPRHFGALSGFGQIALRNGFVPEALVAFETALRINPHLAGVRIVLDDVRRARPAAMN